MTTRLFTIFKLIINNRFFPIVLIFLFSFISSIQLLSEPLVWGDYNLVTKDSEEIIAQNFFYTWSADNFGTTPRMSFSTALPFILTKIPHISDLLIYLILRVLPLFLIPLVTFLLIYRITSSKLIALVTAFFSIANPVIFADILNGQTLYIYPIVLLVFYYCIKIFFQQDFQFRNIFILAVLLFLALGFLPPVIVPLAIVLSIFCLFSIPRIIGNGMFKKLLLILTVLLALSALLVLPYILIANSGQEAYSAPSTLSDYYHNYSKTFLTNVSRLAGNRGGGQETLNYNSFSYTNSAGYILIFFTLISLLLKDSSTNFRDRSTRFAVTLTAIAIMFFLHILTVNVELGEKLFNSQWVAGTIRNPSKIFLILLQLQILIIALALKLLSERLRPSRFYIITFVTILCISIYSWPVFRGDYGLFYDTSKQERTVGSFIPYVVGKSYELGGRSLLVPVNHDDELRYEKNDLGLTIFRLGGSYPFTNEMQKSLVKSFNENRIEFFDYLNILGINNVFLKKGDLYSNEEIPLFKVKNSFEASRIFLASNLNLITDDKDLLLYQNDNALPTVYSPKNIIALENEVEIDTLVGLSSFYNATMISSSKSPYVSFITRCSNKNSCIYVDKNPEITDLKFVTNSNVDKDLQNTEVYYNNETTQTKISISSVKSAPDELITINDLPLDKNNNGYLKLRSGLQDVILYKTTTIANSPIIFNNLDNWLVGDASIGRSGESKIYTRINLDTENNIDGLVLGSENHKAYIKVPLPQMEKGKGYILSLNFKNISGKTFSYSLWHSDNDTPISYSSLKKNLAWSKYYINVNPSSNSPLFLYLYTDSWGIISENVIGEIDIYKVDSVRKEKIYIPSNNKILPTDINFDEDSGLGVNLISNSDFGTKDLKEWEFGNASPKKLGEPMISSLVMNQENNSFAVLKSQNHTAFLSQKIDYFDPNHSYKISISFKNVSGKYPSFAIWQTNSEISAPAGKLTPTSNGWNKFETEFTPDSLSKSAYIYLYSESTNGQPTENLFDDIIISKVAKIGSELELSNFSKENPNLEIENVNKINPTLYQIGVTGSKGLVVFNQSFHTEWRAYIYNSNEPISNFFQLFGYNKNFREIDKKNHVIVNGFANGWIIEDEDLRGKTIVLEFRPQRGFYLGLIVSYVTLAFLIFCISYDFIKRNRKKAKKLTINLKANL